MQMISLNIATIIVRIQEVRDKGVAQAALRRIKEFAKENIADVQQLNVVAEHIKNRLYETALNTNGVESDIIADIAERIDFWVSELKEGEQNG